MQAWALTFITEKSEPLVNSVKCSVEAVQVVHRRGAQKRLHEETKRIRHFGVRQQQPRRALDDTGWPIECLRVNLKKQPAECTREQMKEAHHKATNEGVRDGPVPRQHAPAHGTARARQHVVQPLPDELEEQSIVRKQASQQLEVVG